MNYTIEHLDFMEGHDFEYAVAELLLHNGWQGVEVTQGSNDYGIDILARRKNKKYGIQCKRYSNPVGVKAVQEAASGINYYHCDIAAVITNNTFTKQAENIAKSNSVKLWDRRFLIELIQNYDSRNNRLSLGKIVKCLKDIFLLPQMKVQATRPNHTPLSISSYIPNGRDTHSHLKSFTDIEFSTGISKVCPSCRREFLSGSVKCPICECNLVSITTLAEKRIRSQKQNLVPSGNNTSVHITVQSTSMVKTSESQKRKSYYSTSAFKYK